jgi:hypothetical protein
MADTLKRAQVFPTAGVWTVLIDVFAPTVVSTFRACNVGMNSLPGSKADRIDVRQVYAGEAENDKQYLLRDVPVQAGYPHTATEGWVLLSDDRIYVRSLLGRTAFSISAVEKA